MIIENKVDFLTETEQELLLSLVETKRHRVLVLLMMDAGLRVSEAINLRLSNFFFRERVLRVRTLKRRKEIYRDIPLTNRLVDALADYIATFPNKEADQLLFAAPAHPDQPILRQAVNTYLYRLIKKEPRLKGLHPHTLRHTYATRLIGEGESIYNVKELLGHSTIQSTEVYTHVSADQLRAAVAKLEPKKNWFEKFRDKLTKPKPRSIPINSSIFGNLIIGRDKEINEIQELVDKGVNVLIVGKQGIGKSAILKNIEAKNTARFDEVNKQALQGLCLHILKNDKQALKDLLYKDDEELDTKITKESIASLCELACRIAEKQEYTLIIDDVSSITPRSVKILEALKNHFVIVCAARQVAIDKSSFLSNFQKIELKNLSREHSLLLIDKLSSDILNIIEDYELYRNHIFEQTEGNPGFLREIVDRYRKEEIITAETVRRIRHTAALQEIDLTPFLLLAIALLTISRFIGRATDDSSLTLIGGLAFAFALFARSLFRTSKRKFI